MSRLIRGTTPTITFEVTSEMDLTKLTEIWFTLQDSMTSEDKTYKLSDNNVVVDSENMTISVQLTQDDTLEFKSNICVQIRALDEDGLAYASPVLDVALSDILKGGVISV